MGERIGTGILFWHRACFLVPTLSFSFCQKSVELEVAG